MAEGDACLSQQFYLTVSVTVGFIVKCQSVHVIATSCKMSMRECEFGTMQHKQLYTALCSTAL